MESYLAEVRDEYHMAVKRGVVEHLLRDPEQRARLLAMRVTPPPPKAPTQQRGTAPVPYAEEDAFVFSLEVVARILCYAEDSFLAMLQAYYESLDVRGLLLVDTALKELTLPTSVSEFGALQRSHARDVAEQLRNEWVVKVVTAIEDINGEEYDNARGLRTECVPPPGHH